MKTVIAGDIASGTRAALEQEAAVVHAAAEMQRRYEAGTKPRPQEAADNTGKSSVQETNDPPAPQPTHEHQTPTAAAPAPESTAGPVDQPASRETPESPDAGEQKTSSPDTTARNENPVASSAPSNTPPGQTSPASVGAHSGPPAHAQTGDAPSQGRFKGRKSWKERKRERFQQRQANKESDFEDEDRQDRQDQTPAPLEPCSGMTEIAPKGFGFLRTADKNYVAGRQDVFVPPEFVRKYTLRDGMYLEGECRRSRRGPQMVTLKKINGVDPDKYADRPLFEELKAVNPDRRYLLETDKSRFTTRVIDMLAPIGRGQRGLIVAPPRTGKTTILEHIAQALDHNHPDVHVIVLLVDERPEEVTQMKRVLENAEIYSSSNDSNVKNHVRIAELAIERAKRLVEAGEHVVILLDSITRLGRAYNNAMKGGGRTMSGGIDIRALELPRRLFAAARNTRDGGSLTIIATALVETGSKMDELIFQEFKGTGNMELVLDRKIAQQYVYPAVDIFRSGTRREELLLPEKHLDKIYRVRRGLAGHRPSEAIERLLQIMGKFPSNAQMLLEIPAN